MFQNLFVGGGSAFVRGMARAPRWFGDPHMTSMTIPVHKSVSVLSYAEPVCTCVKDMDDGKTPGFGQHFHNKNARSLQSVSCNHIRQNLANLYIVPSSWSRTDLISS